jgi:L-lactate dehydrogenase complex protein LldE
VNGLELVELARADECCGFGGTFSVKNADTSSAMLADKLQAIVDCEAEVVAALDTSCLTQIGGGLSRRGLAVRTLHLAEILAAGAP